MADPKVLKIAPKSSRELSAGAVVDGRYSVVRPLGSGGTAVVYEVEHIRTGRRLALKVIGDSTQAARLDQEAKATAKLRSRHAVRVVDLGVHAGNPYLVMSLLEGKSLRQLLSERTRVDLATAANIVLQLAECLDEAHGLGLVHRDLKPENLHLRPLEASDDSALFDVTVLDFGVVKMPYDDVGTQLTRTGSTVGTPFYMSLEQLRGAATVDAQSDVYSLSVLLYESFTGTVPFQAATLGDLVFAICSAPPVALKIVRPELPASVSDVVMAGLSSSKADRPKSMRAVADVFRPHADPAFSLWLRGTPLHPSSGPAPDDARLGGGDLVAKRAVDKLVQARAEAVSPQPDAVRTPMSEPPTTVGAAPSPRVPLAPRLPGPPRPPPKPGAAEAKAGEVLEPPMIRPPPGVSGPISRPLPLGAPVGIALRPPNAISGGAIARGPASADPIDEPSTARDEDESPMRAARDRDTPTEMFVKDMHGNVGPPGMLAEAAPPTPAPKNIEPAQYPTMNLDIGPDASESTTVLLLPIGGAHSTPAGAPSRPGQPASHLSLSGVDGTLDPREGPADLSRAPSLSGIAAPTFGTPSQAFLAPQDPTGQGARGQSPQGQGAYPPFTGPPSFAGDAVPSTGSPRSIDVFMNRIGRSGNTLGAKALIQFRAATPGQQALVVGIAAGIGAVILVTLLFLIFF